MTFFCSYEDGTPCHESEVDVCASCGSVRIPGADSTKNPYLVYADTCGHIQSFRFCDNGGTTLTSVATEPTTTVIDDTTTAGGDGTTGTPGSQCKLDLKYHWDQLQTCLSLVCSGVFEDVGGRCLFIDFNAQVSWHEARFLCSEFNADLVVLDDDSLYLTLLSYLRTNGKKQRTKIFMRFNVFFLFESFGSSKLLGGRKWFLRRRILAME